MLKNVIMSPHVLGGIVHNHSSFPGEYRLFAADCETCRGEPMTLQIFDGNAQEDVFLKYVSRGTVLDTFLEYLETNIRQGKTNIVYFHNLSFDLGVLLIQYHKLYAGKRSLKFIHKGVHGIVRGREYVIEACISTPCFASIRFTDTAGKHGTTVKLLDSMSFVPGSLARVAKMLGLAHQKLGKPTDLGEKKLSDAYFEKYAKNDVLVQYDLALWIVEQLKKYRTRFCVSVAQFASRVFKHFFIASYENIKLPPRTVVEAAMLSYHGGKNGYYTDGVTVIDDCVELDITSAYPYAMRNIPNFMKGHYMRVEGLPSEHEGVFCISGDVTACKYPVLYNHEFKPLRGRVDGVWVTSYELREALARNEFIPDVPKIYGWVWVEDKTYRHNPMVEYVDEFFAKKNAAKNPSEKLVYKLLLNSLYGKFIQSIEIDSDDPEFKLDINNFRGGGKKVRLYKAGGLFNPFIATLITGFTRVHLHKLEHQFNAVHASTDSVKLLGKDFVPHPAPKSLGGYELVVRGPCVMLRNKLYLHYDGATGLLEKYALHGFAGNKDELLRMFTAGRRGYTVRHMLRVKEALKRKDKKVPLAMHEMERTIEIDMSKVRHIDAEGREAFYKHETFARKFAGKFRPPPLVAPATRGPRPVD